MADPVKVLHYVSVMNRGGQETFLMNLFRNIDREKVSFDFLCTQEEQGDFDREIEMLGGRIFHIRLNRIPGKGKQIDNAYLLYSYLKRVRNQYEAFHIHTQHAMDGFLSAGAAKAAGIRKVIVHSHNTDTLFHRKAHFVFRPLLGLLPIHRFACSELAGRWMFGKSRFRVVPNGIEADSFSFDEAVRACVRSQQKWEGKYVIGHVGRFNFQKNHRFLLDFFAEFHKTCPGCMLALVGVGELQEEIRQSVEERGLGECVQFLGVRSDVARLYQGMDVFVLPSHFEGLPVTLVEAQAAGLPCLVSDCITEEIKLTELVDMFSLDCSAQQWARELLRIKSRPEPRKSRKNEISGAGYDMKQAASALEEFYRS